MKNEIAHHDKTFSKSDLMSYISLDSSSVRMIINYHVITETGSDVAINS